MSDVGPTSFLFFWGVSMYMSGTCVHTSVGAGIYAGAAGPGDGKRTLVNVEAKSDGRNFPPVFSTILTEAESLVEPGAH